MIHVPGPARIRLPRSGPGSGRARTRRLQHRTGPGTPACAGLATGPWPAARPA